MEQLDYWRLCDELSVSQAAHLVIGMVPGEVEIMEASGAELTTSHAVTYRTNLQAAITAIGNAIVGGRLAGKVVNVVRHQWEAISESMVDVTTDEPDWNRSTVSVSDLKSWLWARGLKSGFFFPSESAVADYLDPNHKRYAPKLAAAVGAWQAVEDPKGKHPKGALTKWLRENGAKFGLCDEDGRPNEQGIEECAKVANWQPSGGAPKTPVAGGAS